MGPSGAPASTTPKFGAEAEKNTLNNLIETHGEHANVPGAPANAIFSSSPVMTTMEMKSGPDALIGNVFENNAGERVYLRGFQDTAQEAATGGNLDGVSKPPGISFDNDIEVPKKPQLSIVETQEEPSTGAASSSNPLEDMLMVIMSFLASLFGKSESNSDTTQAESEAKS